MSWLCTYYSTVAREGEVTHSKSVGGDRSIKAPLFTRTDHPFQNTTSETCCTKNAGVLHSEHDTFIESKHSDEKSRKFSIIVTNSQEFAKFPITLHSNNSLGSHVA